MSNILILGKNGQIARRLYQLLSPLHNVSALSRHDLDFRNLDGVYELITKHKPEIIINACGYTNVDKAEEESDTAKLVNCEAVKTIVKAANKLGAWLVHYSTDYVFDGKKNSAYTEKDKPNPLSIYGQSKLEADLHIQQACKKFIILRVSAIFDSLGHNFPSTILKLAQEKEHLKVINDQFIVPTSALFVAEVTRQIVAMLPENGKEIIGLYHLSPSGQAISWYSFAGKILQEWEDLGQKTKCEAEDLVSINTEQYQQRAKRPQFSQLSHLKIQEVFGLSVEPWDKYLGIFLTEMVQKQ